jgi:hypothetical protein
VIKRIVEMRFSPPENADRVCLVLVLCSTIFPVTRSCRPHKSLCPAPVARNGAILHATGCLVTRSKESPHPNDLREPLEEIQMDARSMLGLFRLNKARKASESRVIEVCNAGRCGNLDRVVGPGARGFPRVISHWKR